MDSRFEERLTSVGFTTLTPIQSAVAEPLANGQSIDALAPTGTGKTLAFTWPLLPKLVPEDGEQLLILAPSQELAMQTTRVVRDWANVLSLKVLSLTGGANIKHQLDRLKKHPEILIGTPGRVSELINNGKLKLKRLRTLILDEADELLRDDTANQIDIIWDAIDDDDVQVALFGATEVDPSTASGLFNREFLRIDQRQVAIPTEIKHEFWLTARDQRQKRLRQLAAEKRFQAIVFFNTTKQLKITASFLAHEHVAMATLARGDSSTTRAKSLTNFRQGKAKFLLTTDAAARGLDIPDLPAVINFDLPRDGETYTHRAGRTGRMGKVGTVISFGNDHDFRDLKKMVAVDIQAISGGKGLPKAEKVPVTEKTSHKNQNETHVARPKSKSPKVDQPRKKKVAATDSVSRQERFAKEKRAKRKHRKNKGKPKHN
ncbi:DEAD/DEAH box helicase [Weissella thailandensis]|uniref:ATP-dependent helicase n=1 Tax=Weissella thailandensis TaxID=89061 RepID=A0ABX9I7X0_9LACO|nr:DEAD/DEAH box helicase [Weissella thailandensis]NKY90909.1 DEAD/DEAH box helicase [Weissella thailandensis]RDS59589.1 ATP-dependent helicase [Weissella thailandensis]GEP74890.1 helicase [Weissella thailandensis]